MNKKYSELAELFRSEKTDEEILDFLLNYHKNDIADMMAGMTEEERKRLYHLLGAQKVAEIFKYIEEPRKYIRELSVESAARVISEMDSDDAVDLLEDLVLKSYPYVSDHEKIDDCMDRILDYAEDSIPVLSEDKRILGVITSEDLIEMVDNEMGEDYAKLAGLTAEEDLKEPIVQSMKKRLPWLIILLFLGMAVSSVVGLFENVVAVLPIVICFQSLVLDMAGNVGTQSLAVTIRVLMDENLTGKQKFQLVVKEVKTGSLNGILLGVMALLCLGVYVHFFKGYTWMGAFGISGCVGVSLLVAMAISSAVGTVIPMFFHKIKVDPAVASGPLITTVNDLVAVVTYYGMAWLLLIR